MRRLLAVVLLAAAVSMTGCLEPFRVRVPADVLATATVPWEEERRPLDSSGWLGPKMVETRYRFEPSDDGPPFPGVVQVFSLRRIDRETTDQLLDRVEAVVIQAMQREHIEPSGSEPRTGDRTLRSGVDTKWFVREGQVREEGGIFDADVRVRILGEAGYDGRSSTAFMVVALVQVERTTTVRCEPLLPTCRPGIGTQRDETTWRSAAADPAGDVGPTGEGILWNLVTHG